MDAELRNKIASMLPDVFALSELDKLTNGLLKAHNMYQVIYMHPELKASFPRRKLGGKSVFLKEEFMKWLEDYYGSFSTRKCGAVTRRALCGNKGRA